MIPSCPEATWSGMPDFHPPLPTCWLPTPHKTQILRCPAPSGDPHFPRQCPTPLWEDREDRSPPVPQPRVEPQACSHLAAAPTPLHPPDRQCEAPWAALAGSCQEAPMLAPGQEKLLGLSSAHVGVKPPAMRTTSWQSQRARVTLSILWAPPPEVLAHTQPPPMVPVLGPMLTTCHGQ